MPGPAFIALVLLYSSLSNGCSSEQPSRSSAANPAVPDSTIIPYDFSQPDAAFALPVALLEISGLAVFDSTHLAAVQDERGMIYLLDRETAQITSEGRFEGPGDFEGIEVADNMIWVLRSDGRLFSVAPAAGGDLSATRHNTDLHDDCDAEGLAFDLTVRRLLISCKENPGRSLGRSRAVYGYEFSGGILSQAPVYLIDRQELDSPGDLFKPSAIAVHPKSGLLYVISSVRSLLIVIDPTQPATILDTRELPETLFPQPEGLAFFPDGTLFISNEGVNGPATLLRFDERIPSR